VSGVDVSSRDWMEEMEEVIVLVTRACGEGIGDGLRPGETGATGVAGSWVWVGEMTPTFAAGVNEASITAESFG